MFKHITVTLLGLTALATGSKAAQVTQVHNLSVEYRQNPLSVDVAQPRLGWNIVSDVRGERQSAYQVLVASTSELLAKN
jgi:alpha-L-rhamnosidase